MILLHFEVNLVQRPLHNCCRWSHRRPPTTCRSGIFEHSHTLFDSRSSTDRYNSFRARKMTEGRTLAVVSSASSAAAAMPNNGHSHRLHALCIVIGLASLTNLVEGFVIGGGTAPPLWLNSVGTLIILPHLLLFSNLLVLEERTLTYLCAHQHMLTTFTLHPLHTPQHAQYPINPPLPCPRHLEMAHHLPH